MICTTVLLLVRERVVGERRQPEWDTHLESMDFTVVFLYIHAFHVPWFSVSGVDSLAFHPYLFKKTGTTMSLSLSAPKQG